jgi:sulfur carrier protein
VIIVLNGDRRELPAGATVASVVALLPAPSGGRGVAVAVGGEVVPRGAWEARQLSDGERVEVLAAIQGG